jgi:hypothetical protein
MPLNFSGAGCELKGQNRSYRTKVCLADGIGLFGVVVSGLPPSSYPTGGRLCRQ